MNHPSHIAAVASLVFNEKKEVLLVKTERRGWELPGGQVEQGEDLISALQREIMEEASVEVAMPKLAAVYSSVSKPSKVIFDFIAEYKNGSVKANNEIMEAKWFSIDEALKNITNEVALFRLKWLIENKGGIRYAAYSKDPFKVIVEEKFEFQKVSDEI